MKPLETKRLLLRAFTQDDFAAVHSYAGSAENTTYMFWGPNTQEETRAFIAMAVATAKECPCTNHQYAAVLKDSGRLVGACNLAVAGDEAELGWILHRAHWRQGLGYEMAGVLLAHAFDGLGLRRVVAHCDAENAASYGLMEKLGMRREGVSLEGHPGNRQSGRPHRDEAYYALLKDEWDTQKEIAYYKSLPVDFGGFIQVPSLSDGEVYLVCIRKREAIPEKKYVPAYDFAVCKGGEQVGEINLRIGYGGFGPNESSLYYGGQIGYAIDEGHRGNGYAARACRLLAPVAKAHGMGKLLITNNETNAASRRVCEKLGARWIRLARLPEWTDLYKDGLRYVNIYEWSVE